MKSNAHRSSPFRLAMRPLLAAVSIALCAIVPAQAQVSIDFGSRGVSIGINVAVYPRLVQVPGYPVYYDPRANSNYFFYDGMYWVYQSDTWYASSWYNGPWELVGPEDVPLYLLRVPVRYYRHPPSYFRGWAADAPPRWGEHWGREWEQRRSGWDQWNRRSVPAPAPLPAYQRQYSGTRYPRAAEQQVAIRDQNYRYQPRDAVTQQHFQEPVERQTSSGASRTEPARKAPIQQRSPASPPRQQAQAPQPNPEQHVQQAQPRQPPAQAQRKEPPAHAQGAPESHPGNAPESRAPQGKGEENRAAPHGNGKDNKDASHGKGEENRKEERDQGRQ